MKKFEKFNLEKNPNLHLEYGKRKKGDTEKHYVEEVLMTSTEKNGASKQHIINTVKKIQNVAKEKNSQYNFMVSIKYGSGIDGWRSGKIFSLDDEPELFNVDEYVDSTGQNKHKNIDLNQKTFSRVVIYKIPTTKKGGCTKNAHNDCLYYCIKEAIGQDNININLNTPKRLKSNLKLDRNDKIDIELMPEVEKLMSLNINVSGEHTYLSSGEYQRTMNIILQDGHYTLDTSKRVKKCLIKPTNKAVGFYRIITNLETKKKTIEIITNSTNETFDFTPGFILEYQSKNNLYLMKDRKNKDATLQDNFKQYQDSAKNLKQHTKGFIDLYKYPQPNKCALYLFHVLSKAVEEPEEISALETTFLMKSSQGALLYSDDGEYKDAVCIDQNSMYAYYMSNDKFSVPTGQGDLQTMTDDEFNNLKYYPVGIYRCIITSTNKDLNRLFRFNKTNYYTHYDLTLAKLLKFDIKIIDNSGANCMMYDSKNRIQGSKMYGSTIDYLYKIKKETNDPYVKKIISSLWGACGEILKYKTSVKYSEECCIEKNIIDIHKYHDGLKIITVDYEKYYKTNYARVGTFLTSFCRLNIAKTILSTVKEITNVKRIHTDGFIIVNEEYKHLLGSEIGKFKIEHSGDCIINNVNDIKWN
jgi:hypothetical protein